MAPDPAPNAAMADYWNDLAGRTWTAYQAALDRQLEPLGREAIDALAPAPGERILDVGCGCGATSLALAERVGLDGSVVGADISRAMLAAARTRAEAAGLSGRIAFQEADVQTAELADAGFDAIFSRFGVMFFSDPQAAFANLKRALKPGGRLAFVCWRPFPENPWMSAPFAAASGLLPTPAPADPDAPGPFAFARTDRILAAVAGGGFENVEIRRFDTRIGGSDVETALAVALNVGPLGSALREQPDLAGPVTAAVREVLEANLTPGGVMMPASAWIVTADAD